MKTTILVSLLFLFAFSFSSWVFGQNSKSNDYFNTSKHLFDGSSQNSPKNKYIERDVNNKLFFNYYLIVKDGFSCCDVQALEGWLKYNGYNIPIKSPCSNENDCFGIFAKPTGINLMQDSVPFVVHAKWYDLYLIATENKNIPPKMIYNPEKLTLFDEINREVYFYLSEYNSCKNSPCFKDLSSLASYVIGDKLGYNFYNPDFVPLIEGFETKKDIHKELIYR